MAKTKRHGAGNNELRADVDPLANWYALNDEVMRLDEKGAAALLDREREGQARTRFMKRIHGRINRLRAERERAEIESLAAEGRMA